MGHSKRYYDRIARWYERIWSRYVARTAEAVLIRLDLRPGLRILDVGCGTGYLLARIDERCSECVLHGLDQSASMLKIAEERLAQAEFELGNAESLPYADDSFDVVISSSMLHHLPLPSQAVREMARVGRSDGQLVLLVWRSDHWFNRMYARLFGPFDPSYAAMIEVRSVLGQLSELGHARPSVERLSVGWWGLALIVSDGIAGKAAGLE